ncbi:hypothetical protein A1704_00230 [Chryseobacterium cucumeris]|uniref:hypothetical protein n=1 Tax=Chryseobacterium cucumeris TaxID=1813611 RepID=UPI00078826C9|nr:hypothetical protein [Chryseobacterium cucumeris]KYH07142.1 hypothetical protein A1704_00230 [Chryseobacterium cucumeris]
MSNQMVFPDLESARKYVKLHAYGAFEDLLKDLKLDTRTISVLEQNELEEKLKLIDDLLSNEDFINKHSFVYTNKENFSINNVGDNFTGFNVSIKYKLNDIKDYIQIRINQLKSSSRVNSINELVDGLPENSVKEELLREIQDLKQQNEVSEQLLKQHQQIKSDINSEKEFLTAKTQSWKDKSDVILKFLDRESIASIVGSVLLLFMGICLLVMMFLEREPIKIVESAFLLILGYFFGHSKNNK